jgi:hypothetical protein
MDSASALVAGAFALAGVVIANGWNFLAKRQENKRIDMARLREERIQRVERRKLLYLRAVKVLVELDQGYNKEVFQERYADVKAELEIYGTPELRLAFRQCINKMQEEDNIAQDSPPDENDGDFRHHSSVIERFVSVVRTEVDILEKAI